MTDVFQSVLTFYKRCELIKTVCFSQAGEYIGGINNFLGRCVRTRRKAMNSFFCSTKRRFKFVGRLNEDVNTYVSLSVVGDIFLTLSQFCLAQAVTQSSKGGMTEAYLDGGTYVKSFYSVMYHPSGVTIRVMSGRVHHHIKWKHTAPMILNQKHKKV